MSQDTDAILVWGFDLGDAEELPAAVQEKIEHWADDGYDEAEAIEAKLGVKLVRYCSGSCPHYVVGVVKTKLRAWRGAVREVASLEVDAAEGQLALAAFAAALGVPAKDGRWLLVSYWSV